ncbi:hypothetical protein GOBAR_AA37636 [Gossypium barbadense]|uniref:Uncharacterized protein n=1 Tax=Gossypium barbadense TaxID=3634 RepID=A0A2P5VW67_GOSBA|nr:hypothetical protein GOBAR_AA37636 [Gossypium barbadense]
MVVPISYVDSQSTIHGIDIDLNAALETDVVGNDVYHSSDPSDHEVDSESDPDVDEVPDDIDDEAVNDDGNVNTSLVGNQIRRIVVHNNPGVHLSRIDPDAAHAVEFLEYPEILSAYWMAVYSDPEELFVGQRFKSKEECVFAIKLYSMNISVDYKVSVRGRRKAAISGYELHLSRSRRLYTLERTLRVWENEFPVLPDISTWEVPPTTFEFVLDKGLRRNLKGRPQSSRIHNEIDIREKSDGKLCGVYRLAGHN